MKASNIPPLPVAIEITDERTREAFDDLVQKLESMRAHLVEVINTKEDAGAGGAVATFSEFALILDRDALQWVNMPAAATEFGDTNQHRLKVDLTQFSQFRLQLSQNNAGAAGSKLWVEYSTDQSTWAKLESGGGATGDVAISTGTSRHVGAFATIVAAAKADVFLRVVGSGGDGVTDPSFRTIRIQVK